jgi:hypothetical protein
MEPAVASLIGAVIGGTLTSGSNLLLERARATRERKSAERQGKSEARRAARLIAEELDSARQLLVRSHHQSEYAWDPVERQLPSQSWTDFRSDFAGGPVDDEQWQTVSKAYRELDRINWHLRSVLEEEPFTHTGPRHPMERRDVAPAAKLGQAIGAVDDALRVLRRLMAADV